MMGDNFGRDKKERVHIVQLVYTSKVDLSEYPITFMQIKVIPENRLLSCYSNYHHLYMDVFILV